MNQVIAEKLKQLPDLPGCYLMKDQAGTVIYVGKAVNLKRRVSSYFHGAHDPKTELLVADISDFETVVVDSESEALILEANLVKRHMPRYNVLLRDDKHYPYLRLTLNEDYPRLLVARRASRDGSRYFGPYPNAGGMHRALEAIMEDRPKMESPAVPVAGRHPGEASRTSPWRGKETKEGAEPRMTVTSMAAAAAAPTRLVALRQNQGHRTAPVPAATGLRQIFRGTMSVMPAAAARWRRPWRGRFSGIWYPANDPAPIGGYR